MRPIMPIHSKYNYLRTKRQQITTTIAEPLYKDLKELSVEFGQPMTKLIDCALLTVFKDESTKTEFINKVKNY